MANKSLQSSKVNFEKRSIIQKTIQVGSSTLVSRVLGLLREVLMVRYLGPGNPLSDAFITAYKLPNSLRKVFAEGALSASFIPTVVGLVKEESKEEVSKLISFAFIVFQGVLIAFCGLIFWKAEMVVRCIAPGWFLMPGAIKSFSSVPVIGSLLEWVFPAWYVISPAAVQAQQAIPLVRMLIGFIVLLSSSALLTGALQSVNHFFVPAFAPVLLNVIFIAGIGSCLFFGSPVSTLCYFIMAGGVIQFMLHVYVYYRLNFSFSWFDRKTWVHFKPVLIKFFPCLLSMSIMEFNLFMSTTLASYLPKGSISLVYYANRFMGIPLGVFAVAFSTILLPHFSRLAKEGKEELSQYLFEATKLIFWMTVPVGLIMSVLSRKIFITFFLSRNFTMMHVDQAATILVLFLSCIFFFSLNKILLNVYYSLHDTRTPVLVSLSAAVTNYLLSKVMLKMWGIYGLVGAFVIAGVVQTIAYIVLLKIRFNISMHPDKFVHFFKNAALQIVCALSLFSGMYLSVSWLLKTYLSERMFTLIDTTLLVWVWVVPLVACAYLFLYGTRKLFNVNCRFLD